MDSSEEMKIVYFNYVCWDYMWFQLTDSYFDDQEGMLDYFIIIVK